MKLIAQELEKIIIKIIEGGGETFLSSLNFCVISQGQEHQLVCCACDKSIGRHGRAYVITNREAVKIFDDLYHNPECAQLAIKWVHHLYIAFRKFLGWKENRDLTFADLSDPYVQMSLRRFRFQHHVPVKRLKEFALEARKNATKIGTKKTATS